MRQRKAKDLEQRLEICSPYLIRDPEPQCWEKVFGNDNPIYLEIGCGKGNFILQKALENPDKNYIAVEGQETVILRALEKAREHDQEEGSRKLTNLKFMLTFVHRMADFFHEDQLAGVYLNFSDPWPKARHAKRRLTYHKRMEDYRWAIKPGGFVEIKTDNDPLYAFSLEEIQMMGYPILEQTTDLHASEFESKKTMTEYEAKFHAAGKNINYVKVGF